MESSQIAALLEAEFPDCTISVKAATESLVSAVGDVFDGLNAAAPQAVYNV